MSSKVVRTRIAPSPTGDPHVGTAYIALFNLCFARQHQGQFILRIEDTDQARSNDFSEQQIFHSLHWLGLEWDEGPDVGGDYGPYRQSERKDSYAKYAEELLEKGHAFKCYRTTEELNTLREQRKAEGKHTALKPSDLVLPDEEVKKREAAAAPFVIRMNVPEEGRVEVQDMLRGVVELDWSQVDAQILLKSDGLPTYHLANVVDDHLMEITHVLRGEEWINSAPKHKLLYEYFGWQMPELCHLPLLRNPDKSKLSKRKNPTSINYYKRMGFLPEAVVNYLGRMGWSMPDESEKFSLQEMMDNFDIQRVSLGGPIFDVDKLGWLNGLWIREELNDEQLAERIQEWALNKEYLMQVVPHIKERIDVLSDALSLASFLLEGHLPVSVESFEHKSLEPETTKKILQFVLWKLETLHPWDRQTISDTVMPMAERMDIKIRDFLFPVFIAVAGTSASFSVMDGMAILGPDMTRARLRFAIELLGGLGKKPLKKLEKEFRDF